MPSAYARLLLIAAFMALALSTASAQQLTRAERRGEALLITNCAMCHAVGRTGSSPHVVAPPFRVLSKRYPIESLQESLGEGLMSGHPDMPEFVFPSHDVGAIIAYLKAIQEP
jgi:cytochrome c